MQNLYLKILDEISRTARSCGRDPADIKLVAVTKTVGWDKILPLYDAGQRDFGENRVSDALEKKVIAPKDCRWHLIGSLQSNKVRKAIGNFVLIHSVDTPELAKKLSDASVEAGVVTSILLQVNISGEGSKHGLSAGEWIVKFQDIHHLPGIKIEGLMTMAPMTEDLGTIRSCFRGLRELRDEMKKLYPTTPLKELSMGMSGDFKIAIEEGATLVRIGSALFR